MPKAALLSILLFGAIAALLVTAGGWLLERATIGATEEDARQRVEVDVRQMFDVMARRLRDISSAVADPVLVQAAAAEDTTAARRLFELAADAIAGDEEAVDAALTVFAADGTPLAWAGRPSDLGAQPLGGGESWFLSRLVLGPRLVYVRPLLEGSTPIPDCAAGPRPLPFPRASRTSRFSCLANRPPRVPVRAPSPWPRPPVSRC